jgi:hypothetical protein
MAILKGVTFLDPAWTKSITPRLMPAALATKVDKPALPVRPKKSRLLCPLFVSILSPKVKNSFCPEVFALKEERRDVHGRYKQRNNKINYLTP